MQCILDDLAYLLGLTCGRGKLDYSKKHLTIHFLYKSIKATGVTKTFDQEDKLIIGLDPIVNKLIEFTGIPVKKLAFKNQIDILVPFGGNTHTWQNITHFFNYASDYTKFRIPSLFFQAPGSAKLNFLKGFADVAGFIRKSNYDQSGRHRVYLEIMNSNWVLPIQICSLLQDPTLNIPVQNILWGHPNTRGKGNWAKEHQVRIYAEYFEPVGFNILYKQEILEELAAINTARGNKVPKPCDPVNKSVTKRKTIHPDEHSPKICSSIRGKHFDTYWQICCALGCKQ
ncbi:hypothetical protein MFMK1_001303 [Metallumcola ferriviriculae]|uniref:LAGLIDADG homing endonuclease n=1 Tax=Metallumcola ferriviriculae TaxID=3039180 RepID=A0AAU0UQP3_9FIRM|nr:hypothetical protein MFMK1_001303 [Desulfitibacteraceae bacterium MK1]